MGRRTLGWLTLVVLAFVAGGMAARIWWPDSDAGGSTQRVTPATATQLPPTPAPAATATATASDSGAAPAVYDPLPTLYIDIAPDDFALIEAKREEALKTWILQTGSEDLVPATVRVDDGAPVPVRLRLKGDWGDHFTREKWSYRVEVRGNAAVLGMRVFSIQDPSTRSYVDEWSFLTALRQEGVLSVGYRFAHVVQNGQPMGVYAVEEGFSKELLESQNRRDSVIIRYNEDLLWEYWSAYTNDLSTPPGVERFHIIDEFQSGVVSADPVLAARRDAAIGKLRAWELGTLPASDVFDIDLLARFWAYVDLWGARHAVYWNNLRYYYNPVTTLLEPVVFDAQPLRDELQVDVSRLPGLNALSETGDPQLQRAYVRALWAFTEPEYLVSLQDRLSDDLVSLYAVLEPEFGGVQTPEGRSVLAPPWDLLEERRVALREVLSPVQMTYAYESSAPVTGTTTIAVGNLVSFPVEVVGIEVGDAWIPADGSLVHTGGSAALVGPAEAGESLVLPALDPETPVLPYAWLSTAGAVGTEPADVAIVTRLWGLTTTITRPVLPAYPPPVRGDASGGPDARRGVGTPPLP